MRLAPWLWEEIQVIKTDCNGNPNWGTRREDILRSLVVFSVILSGMLMLSCTQMRLFGSDGRPQSHSRFDWSDAFKKSTSNVRTWFPGSRHNHWNSSDLKFATYRLMARDETLEGFCIASYSSADCKQSNPTTVYSWGCILGTVASIEVETERVAVCLASFKFLQYENYTCGQYPFYYTPGESFVNW